MYWTRTAYSGSIASWTVGQVLNIQHSPVILASLCFTLMTIWAHSQSIINFNKSDHMTNGLYSIFQKNNVSRRGLLIVCPLPCHGEDVIYPAMLHSGGNVLGCTKAIFNINVDWCICLTSLCNQGVPLSGIQNVLLHSKICFLWSTLVRYHRIYLRSFVVLANMGSICLMITILL